MQRFIGIFVLIVLLSAGAAQAQTAATAPNQSDVQEYRVTIAHVNIRTCAQTSCATMTTYAEGTPLFVLGSETGDAVQGDTHWYRIRDSVTGQIGYINDVLTTVHSFDDWQLRPVVPASISDAMKQLYQAGIAAGDILRRIAQCLRPAKFLEAHEMRISAADLEEQVGFRFVAIVGAIVDDRGKIDGRFQHRREMRPLGGNR